MRLTNIESLYKEMLNNNLTRQQFDFEYNGVVADVFFFIDQNPFILAFGIKLTQAYFELEMKSGFEIKTSFSNEIYNLIIHEFHIQYDPTHKYHPFDFLNIVNSKIPQHIKGTHTVEPCDVAIYHRDVEEANRKYFVGFVNHSGNGRHVRRKNLEKTWKFMGYEAYQRCLQENISTKWTDEIGKDKFKEWRNIRPNDYLNG